MIPYTSFRYLFPPRPENALPASTLHEYDNGKFLAQPKLNGDCMLVFTNGIETHIRDRHNKEFNKALSTKLLPHLKKLHKESSDGRTNKWMVLVGEYMIKSKKNTLGETWNEKFVIQDIIVFDGVQLIGKTFQQRQELLDDLYGTSTSPLPGAYIDNFLYATEFPEVYRVRNFYTSFDALWKELVVTDMYEGLVLKVMNAKLENGSSQKNNTHTQLKFRKQTKNYVY